MPRIFTLTAEPEAAGERLDRFLRRRLPELSRARLQALVQEGGVSRDGALITDPASRVKPGQAFTVEVPEPRPATPAAEALPLEIVYEDEHLVVLEKPAGLVVHPAAGHASGTLVNALLAHCGGGLSGIGGIARPGIVHRLDKDVSGLLVVAKHDRAHVGLAAQFSVHRVERAYDAIVWGRPAQAAGTIDAPIGRDPRHRQRMAVVPGGKRAVTHYRVLRGAGARATWLELRLATGRTHQIRVHLAAQGLGIIGDPLYRPPRARTLAGEVPRCAEGLARLALHARRLGFEHPISGERLCFDRPPPAAFETLFGCLAQGT